MAPKPSQPARKRQARPPSQEDQGGPGPSSVAARAAAAAADSPATQSSSRSEGLVHKSAVTGGWTSGTEELAVPHDHPPESEVEDWGLWLRDDVIEGWDSDVGGLPDPPSEESAAVSAAGIQSSNSAESTGSHEDWAAWIFRDCTLESPFEVFQEIGWIWLHAPNPTELQAKKNGRGSVTEFFESCDHAYGRGIRNIPENEPLTGNEKELEILPGRCKTFPKRLQGICRVCEYLSYLYNFYRYWTRIVAPKFRDMGTVQKTNAFVNILGNRQNISSRKLNPMQDLDGTLRIMFEEFLQPYTQRWRGFNGWVWAKMIQLKEGKEYTVHAMPYPAFENSFRLMRCEREVTYLRQGLTNGEPLQRVKNANLPTPHGVPLNTDSRDPVPSPFTWGEVWFICPDPGPSNQPRGTD